MQPNQQYPPQGYAPQPQYAPPAPPQYPPQGYPQQPPQYGPPPGYPQQPPAQPQYAPPAAPQQAAPQTQYGPPRAPDAPAATVTRPRLQDFGRDGRLVLISPSEIKRGLPNRLGKPGDTQDRMTADVVILDGNAFPFGGQPEKGVAHTLLSSEPPYEIPAMFISSAPLISQCERRVGESVLGRLRIVPLQNGNSAYRIDDPTQADFEVANAFIAAKAQGRVAAPQPAPQSAPPQPQPQQAPPQYMTQPAPVPAYNPGGAVPQPQQYPQQPQYGPPPTQQLDIDTVPPNTDPNWWAAQPPEYRQMVVGSLQSQQRPGV